MTNNIDSNKISELLNKFGLSGFKPNQQTIINSIISGKNVLAILPTGAGKSLCYQIPALYFNDLTIVISPLISLMNDQVNKLKDLSIEAERIHSSMSKSERLAIYKKIMENKYKIIYISPERMRKKEFKEAISNRKIDFLVVDEAHCLSQWGFDFRPDYLLIKNFIERYNIKRIAAFTATANERVQKEITKYLGLDDSNLEIFNHGICRPNIYLESRILYSREEKFKQILEVVKSNPGGKIIYFNLIKSLDEFSAFLDEKYKGKYRIYHGKLPSYEKNKSQRYFTESDSPLILATNSFGLGIDRPDIRGIIHAEIPISLDNFYQELGRGGRDGLPAKSMLFYHEDDLAVLLDFLDWKNPSPDFIQRVYKELVKHRDHLQAFSYDELQETIVYRNSSDQRLQTVLNLFDLYDVTSGAIEVNTLKLTGELPQALLDEDKYKLKLRVDQEKLLAMLNYVKETACRRDYLHKYFNTSLISCENCDHCLGYDNNHQ